MNCDYLESGMDPLCLTRLNTQLMDHEHCRQHRKVCKRLDVRGKVECCPHTQQVQQQQGPEMHGCLEKAVE